MASTTPGIKKRVEGVRKRKMSAGKLQGVFERDHKMEERGKQVDGKRKGREGTH